MERHMIDGSEKRNRQLAFELQNSHVCEKCCKSVSCFYEGNIVKLWREWGFFPVHKETQRRVSIGSLREPY